jgi:hypothetical protein
MFKITNSVLIIIKIAKSILYTKETQNYIRTTPDSKASSMLASF